MNGLPFILMRETQRNVLIIFSCFDFFLNVASRAGLWLIFLVSMLGW